MSSRALIPSRFPNESGLAVTLALPDGLNLVSWHPRQKEARESVPGPLARGEKRYIQFVVSTGSTWGWVPVGCFRQMGLFVTVVIW